MTRTGDTALTRLARERIGSGELPCARATRMWGSRGTGATCALCNLPIGPHQVEYEVELGRERSPSSLQFHLACYSIWQNACETCSP